MEPKIIRHSIAPLALLLGSLLAACGVEPSSRTPSLVYDGVTSGCGDIFVYMRSTDRMEALVVDAWRSELELSTAAKSFDLGQTGEKLKVRIELFSRRSSPIPYCSDLLAEKPETPAVWRAIAGTAIISLSDTSTAFNEPYRATVRLENVTFASPTGEKTVVLKELLMNDALVGWFPG
jgi:hypothetical protein